LATSRAVRIPRASARAQKVPRATSPREAEETPKRTPEPPAEWRANTAGSQRAIRITVLYLVILVALYIGFVLYDRTAPGGTASPLVNGVLLFSVLFAALALTGVYATLTAAPRGIEVTRDRVTVVGRWGRRRTFPPLEQLSFRVARRYSAGFLTDSAVVHLEIWGKGFPVRSYLVSEELFAGAVRSERDG